MIYFFPCSLPATPQALRHAGHIEPAASSAAPPDDFLIIAHGNLNRVLNTP